jgi:hypothetical protein
MTCYLYLLFQDRGSKYSSILKFWGRTLTRESGGHSSAGPQPLFKRAFLHSATFPLATKTRAALD